MADSAQLLLDTEANGTQRTMVDDLLEDLWRMVFAHCSTLDLVRICMLVCQQWRVWAKEITERAIILNSNWKGYNGELQVYVKTWMQGEVALFQQGKAPSYGVGIWIVIVLAF